MQRYQLHCGDNRAVLKTMSDNSVDSIVCDPPYELGFMGKRWDASGIAYDTTLWTECLRVLKPGGHLIAFGGTRTYHRMTVAIEDAGFEIRDSIIWMYGSGFPKSLDVSKAIDKQAGAEREVVGEYTSTIPNITPRPSDGLRYSHGNGKITAPATPEAQQWHGWGTALKPAHENAVLARKPLTGTVADNVLTWGTGALNIDGSRVSVEDGDYKGIGGGSVATNHIGKPIKNDIYQGGFTRTGVDHTTGRWPANVILDEHAAEALDEQSGVGASRFFYIAKASRTEREAGLEGMEVQIAQSTGMSGDSMPLRQDGTERKTPLRANHHPTVKPIALMRHLVRLVTPKGGVVLDPFMGSGSTGCAAMLKGMRFVGIDITAEYVDIAERRIQHWLNQNPMEL